MPKVIQQAENFKPVNSSQGKSFDFPEIRVVEASAGSGKTYALAKRYVQLLLNFSSESQEVSMKEILAITFTNKASLEMKLRILEFLKKIALGTLSETELQNMLGPLGMSRQAASQKAFRLMDFLIQNYNFFQVQTIDKFINTLLTGCAFKLGFTANFQIKTNSIDYLQESLDQLIDSAAQNIKLKDIFEEFLHHYLYLENRSNWFAKDDMLDILKTLFAQYNCYGFSFKASDVKPSDIIKRKRLILDKMKKLRDILPETTDKRFVKSLEKFLSEHKNSFDIGEVSTYFLREAPPVKENEKGLSHIEKLWEQIRRELKGVCEDEAFSMFNPYIQAFREMLIVLHALAVKEDVIFLEELNKRARKLFEGGFVTVQELYYRLATRIRHYLVDEFQDTSRLQWENLKELVEEAVSSGGSLFYVGDQKQAIYGFRGGETGLFEEVKEKFKTSPVRIESLANNWRSQKAVVEFNNRIFSSGNLTKFLIQKSIQEDEAKKKDAVSFTDEDTARLENIFKGAQQTYEPANDKGHVHFEYVDTDKKEDRDCLVREKLLSLLKNLKERFDHDDIAILTRGNQEIETLTGWLLQEGIQVESERTLNIKANLLVIEVISLLKFLNSPIDNVSFALFLLGDIFHKAVGIGRQELHDFIFGLRSRLLSEKDVYVYAEFRRRYPKVWEGFLEGFFKNVGLYPLYELVVSIYHRFQCLDNFPENQGFFMHFLELLKSKEEECSDLAAFLDYFEKREGEEFYVPGADTEAVKILTIHKAKGLEFPVVILPFLGMDVQPGNSSENKQSYIFEPASGQDVHLLRVKKEYSLFSQDLFQIYKREYKKAFISELNNVYVALTRAKFEMYGFIPKKVGGSFNLAQLLIPQDLCRIGEPAVYPKAKAKRQAFQKLPLSDYHDWLNYLKEEFIDQDELKYGKEKLTGEVMHYALSLVKNLDKDDKKKVFKDMEKNITAEFPYLEGPDEYVQKAKQLIDAKELKEFFYLKDADVLTECDVVSSYGHGKRIDRLIIKEKDIWIVDYKSSQDALGRQEEQVREYISIIKELYPKKKVSGFLIYLDKLTAQAVK